MVGNNLNHEGGLTVDGASRVIDHIVVDPDDVIEALRFNGRPEGSKNQRSAVLRITPSFESESEASIFYEETGDRYPPEISQPIHINPAVFVDVEKVRPPMDVKRDAKENAKEELDTPTEEEIDEWIEGSMDVWEENVRRELLEETDINDSKRRPERTPHVVAVSYESDE